MRKWKLTQALVHDIADGVCAPEYFIILILKRNVEH